MSDLQIDSRCGLHCTGCEYREPCNCSGCIETNGHPFHGECPVAICCQEKGIVHCGECPDIPCELLTQYSCDPEHGDTPRGARIVQCLKWKNTANRARIGEVCLATSDVIRLANFYKILFNIDNGSDDTTHQFIISEETTLTIWNDGIERTDNLHNILLAFTVDDVDVEYERLKALDVQIVSPPTVRPWGAKNMSFLDPDNNLITFRSFRK